MFYVIFGGLFLALAIVLLLLTSTGKGDTEIRIRALVVSVLCGSLLIVGGVGLRAEAKKTYAELTEYKRFLEENYTSNDIVTQLKVHDTYISYMFKYEHAKASADEGIFACYWDLDLDALKLNIPQEE